MSFKFPIGVATMCRPFDILFIIITIIFINSCSPVNLQKVSTNDQNNQETTKKNNEKKIVETIKSKDETLEFQETKNLIGNSEIIKDVTVLFLRDKKLKITEQFIDVLEMGIYHKGLENINLKIDKYNNINEFEDIVVKTAKMGKIYIGPMDNESSMVANRYCDRGVIFFSFSSDTSLAKDCVYLINFFPRNELEQLFNFLDDNSKVALLYPENDYGYMINGLLDDIANNSNAVIINRSSYKNDLSNVRNAIKELGKYELRKYELERQKQILSGKEDNKSKKRLKKLEKFKTTNDYDFTHVLIADYGLNLLQVAPLLPYYDIDPNIVQFMGTGVIDDINFFYEPSLQKAIFPGVEIGKRSDLIESYSKIYNNSFIRISTLPYDLIGLLNYIFSKNITFIELVNLLNNSNIKFDGVDGNFYFRNNMIERDLNVLRIKNGKAVSIN